MPAYVIARINVTDPQRYTQYTAGVPASIARYGGRFVVRGPKVDVLEGSYDGRRLVVIEFPSMERLRAWWDSPEYAALRPIRLSASEGDVWAVEGA